MPAIAPPPPWAADYVGLPFRPLGRGRDGVDCWGLLCLVYRERFRIRLPDWIEPYADPHDRTAAAGQFARAAAQGWRRIDPSSAREGDAVLLRQGGVACHVGLFLGWPWLLHAEPGTETALDRLDGIRWSRRVDSVWRHPEMLP